MLPNLASQASSMWEINQALRTLIEQNRWVYLIPQSAYGGEAVRFDRVTGAYEVLISGNGWYYWEPQEMRPAEREP